MRILVVEDDPEIRQSLIAGLETEAFVVDSADNGEDGSYLARTNEYDLMLLDLALPRKDGCTICTEVRASGTTTPIIMLSVMADAQEKIKLLNAGADDYLSKPYSFRELMARIRALLRRPRVFASEVIQIDDLKLDSRRQKVTRGNKEVYLTRKEFALLEYLLQFQGVVISRGMMMEHVWNAESDPFSNTIEAHILNIRKKVDAGSKRKLIHTIPGRGYTIDVKPR
jgi:DNA-binding response OmpR family regulator